MPDINGLPCRRFYAVEDPGAPIERPHDYHLREDSACDDAAEMSEGGIAFVVKIYRGKMRLVYRYENGSHVHAY